MKNKGFGHLETRLCTIKTSKHVGFGGPLYSHSLLDPAIPCGISLRHPEELLSRKTGHPAGRIPSMEAIAR